MVGKIKANCMRRCVQTTDWWWILAGFELRVFVKTGPFPNHIGTTDQINQWFMGKQRSQWWWTHHDMNFWNFSENWKCVYFCAVWLQLQDSGGFPPRQTSLNLPPSSWVCHSVVRACGVVDKISTDPGEMIVWVTIASDCRPFPSSASTAEEVMFITGR